jgi:uncharacterized low-complexity protein
MNVSKVSLALALTTALGTTGSPAAAENPFGMQVLSQGYMLADAGVKVREGKCGEGKCGASKVTTKAEEGKCGEGKCGASKGNAKTKEGKCGEGRCGANRKGTGSVDGE